MLDLRPYQKNALNAVLTGWGSVTKQLAVLPTGGGKTIVFSHLAQATLPGRTLILAHREELIDQAIEKLHRATGIYAQKEKASDRASLAAQVVVASIQTMGNRLHRWPADHFSLVVVDEAHHCAAKSYQTVLKHFDGTANILGVTATPDRADRKNLGNYFQKVACEITLLDLIRQKYLSPIKVRALPLKIDLSNVRKVAGDFSADDLDKTLSPYLRSIAAALRDEAPFRKTLVFLPLIATSLEFTEICKEAGINAAHVDGTSENRKEILERFSRGEFDLLSNAMLLTEGYDEPSVDCVVVLRPTRSRALYSQMVGRGTRLAPSKRDLLLLDFLWLHEKHDLVRPAHLIAQREKEEDAADEMSEIIIQASETQQEFDLDDLQSTARKQREAKIKKELEAKAKKTAREVDALEFCMSIEGQASAEYRPDNVFDGQPVTQGQLDYLKQEGIDSTGLRHRGHAQKVIDLMQRRRLGGFASPKQIRMLKQFKHRSPYTATKEEASSFISIFLGNRRGNYRTAA